MSEKYPLRPLSAGGVGGLLGFGGLQPLPQLHTQLSLPNHQENAPLQNPVPLTFAFSTEPPAAASSSFHSFTFEDKSLWKDTFAMLYDFYQDKMFCDIELHVGSRILHCHRIILACFSQYFRSMFTSNMCECVNNIVTINDVDEIAFTDLVNFAYTSKITLTTENVQTLLFACSILQVDSVACACCHFMTSHLHPSNCIGIRNFAEQHGQTDLIAKADEYILDNFAEVQNSEEWNQMTPPCIRKIVGSSSLNIRSEKEVYEAVIKWLKSDLEQNKAFLVELTSKIKLPLLPSAYLLNVVCTEELLKQNLECRDYMDEAKSYQLSLAQVISYALPPERIKPRKSYAGK